LASSIPPRIEDRARPASTGIWDLTIDAGKGTLAPSSDATGIVPLAFGAAAFMLEGI
jgi:hypothetical protein